MSPEYAVYALSLAFFNQHGFDILCASPPVGTDPRFYRCLLPRRDLKSSVRGLRDEVDLTVRSGLNVILLECKVKLSHSLSTLNSLGESDDVKLRRIVASHSKPELLHLLSRSTGAILSPASSVHCALIVGEVDCALPLGITVIEVQEQGYNVWVTPSMRDVLPR